MLNHSCREQNHQEEACADHPENPETATKVRKSKYSCCSHGCNGCSWPPVGSTGVTATCHVRFSFLLLIVSCLCSASASSGAHARRHCRAGTSPDIPHSSLWARQTPPVEGQSLEASPDRLRRNAYRPASLASFHELLSFNGCQSYDRLGLWRSVNHC